jgi:hypothetical protein
MAKYKKIEGICPYCGKRAILTRDHVIPQCLYINGVPGNSPKVHACSHCNNDLKSRLDTYFRDFLVLDIEGSEHPVSKSLFPKLARAVKRKQSVMALHIMQAQLMPRFTPSGLFAGFVYGIQLPDQSITTELSMMTRGLYYFYTRQMLPQNISFTIHRQWDMQKYATDIQLLLSKGAHYVAAGEGDVFECMYAIPQEKPTCSLWFLSFLRKVYFSVTTDYQTLFDQAAG